MTALGWYDLQVSCSSCPVATPSVVTTLPGSRIIRQSSQPESSVPCCGASCVHGTAPSTSLRQLRDHGDGIAGIAADSLRINGAMRNFRQVWGRVDELALNFFTCNSIAQEYNFQLSILWLSSTKYMNQYRVFKTLKLYSLTKI